MIYRETKTEPLFCVLALYRHVAYKEFLSLLREADGCTPPVFFTAAVCALPVLSYFPKLLPLLPPVVGVGWSLALYGDFMPQTVELDAHIGTLTARCSSISWVWLARALLQGGLSSHVKLSVVVYCMIMQ